MLGFDVDLIDWLLSPELNVIGELNEVKRMVRLCGKGQQHVQSHVSEAYSPVRVTGMAEKMGLIPGLAMGLTTCDEHGNPWDFNCEVMRAQAKKLIKSKAAMLLVVSPMCAAFSGLQTFNAKVFGVEKMSEMLQHGMDTSYIRARLVSFRGEMGYTFYLSMPRGPQAGTRLRHSEC